jgi:hypothetical protein
MSFIKLSGVLVLNFRVIFKSFRNLLQLLGIFRIVQEFLGSFRNLSYVSGVLK